MDEQDIRAVIREVLSGVMAEGKPAAAPSEPAHKDAGIPAEGRAAGNACQGEIPLEVSARHVHLTRQAVEQLFGAGATLTKKRELSQPGEFLSEQRVKLITKKGVLENVAVLGPERGAVQVELSLTDCRALGIDAPVNLSGDLTNAGDVMLAGDCGCFSAPGSVIAARAHVHMTPSDARAFGVRDGEHVRVELSGARPTMLCDVRVRVKESYALACHIDFDEANAAAAACGTPARIVGKSDCAPLSPARPAQGAAPERHAAAFAERLVTEAMARAVRAQGGEVRIQRGTIVTPAARDVFSNAHMRVTYVE